MTHMDQLDNPNTTSDSATPVDATAVGDGALAQFSAIQQLDLTRYARLDMLRRQELPGLPATDWRARLINKALFSTYEDCVAAGVGEEARLFSGRDSA